MCLKKSFGFVFPSPHQFNKHSALFVSFDCHGDSTNVIPQTASMAHQPCESMQKGMKPDLILSSWAADTLVS